MNESSDMTYSKANFIMLVFFTTLWLKKTNCQKQSLWGVLQKKCSLKFCQIYTKAAVSGSLCCGLQPKNEVLEQVFSCELCGIFENTFFTKHLWVTASAMPKDDCFLQPLLLLYYHFFTTIIWKVNSVWQ